MKFITIIVIVCFAQVLKSQNYNSRNNFTGNWEDPATWDFEWSKPTNLVNYIDLNVYGYVSLHGSLSITGANCTLTVHDTLVVDGDLWLGNLTNLVVGGNGLLIVKGNFNVVNSTDIFTNGYIIVAENFINTSTSYGGSFWTMENPAHVFIAGIVPVADNISYPVIDCDHTLLDRFEHSGCAYGNMEDLMEDPVFEFYVSICSVGITTSSNSPLCEGQRLKLTATGGSNYHWSGPADFNSDTQNPEIQNISSSNSGLYVVQVSFAGCSKSDTLIVVVNDNPHITVTVNNPVCEGQSVMLVATGADQYQWSGPGSFSSTLSNPVIPSARPSMIGQYFVKGTTQGCTDSANIHVTVATLPIAFAGYDITLENEHQVYMDANKVGFETGKWSVISGSGSFADDQSPESMLSGLKDGENIFRWTTANGSCMAYDEIMVKVIPMFIPNVITPNSDGKNDFLILHPHEENTELLIFDRTGNTVYSTSNYSNDWNGVNISGNQLPDDTYYFVIQTADGQIHKGSLLIKRK